MSTKEHSKAYRDSKKPTSSTSKMLAVLRKEGLRAFRDQEPMDKQILDLLRKFE